MEDDPDEIDYYEYVSALKELVDAQKKAREYSSLFPHKPTEKPSELTVKGTKAFQRLNQAYEEYAKKCRAWRDYLKGYGL